MFFSCFANNISNPGYQPAPGIFSSNWWNLLKKPGASLVNQPAPGLFSRFFQNIEKKCAFHIVQTISQIQHINQHQVFFVVIDETYLKNLVPLWKSTCTTTKDTWRTSQKFKPNPNEIFLRSKNILAWVRFKFLDNQAFIRRCGGLPPLGSVNRIWLG